MPEPTEGSLAYYLRDEAARRDAFPIVASKLFFAHAAAAPLPAFVRDTMKSYLDSVSSGGQFGHFAARAEADLRRDAATMVGRDPAEVAIIPSTSAGIGAVARGICWNRGDRVLVADGDFPANVYPWMQLGDLGVEVDRIPWEPQRRLTTTLLSERLDERTRLVALSSCDWLSGAALDVNAVGGFLRAQGIAFCVDAIQTLGAYPLDAANVDFLVADGHKWLVGPQGVGVLVVASECREEVVPWPISWRSVETKYCYLAQARIPPLASTGRRFEPGGLNSVGVTGLAAAFQLLRELGLEKVARQIRLLRERLEQGVASLGFEVLGPRDAGPSGGILSFRAPGDLRALWRALDERDCIVSLRRCPDGADCIRLSPHAYNTLDEVDALLAILNDVA